MKNLIKKTFLVVLCLLLVMSFAACGDGALLTNPIVFDEEHPVIKEDSFTAAENDQYQLKWDASTKRIVLYDKLNDVNWSSTPSDIFEPELDEFGDPITNNPKLETTLMVEYIETNNFTVKTANAYVQSLNKGTYALEKIENGFKITYYFDTLGISIPVKYTLNKDGVSFGIDPSQIAEDGSNLVYRVHFAPFFCSVPNIKEDSYLFYPSGNGALIYADTETEVGTGFEYDIYGGDNMYMPTVALYNSNVETIKMPVYGAKNGNQAVLAVINEGAETATLYTDIGDSAFGHSTIYPIFNIRGKQTASKAVNNATQYSDQYSHAKIEVTFYPLYNENANYVGMANKYREFLINEKGLEDKQEKSSVSLSLIGGTQVPDSFLGVPTTSLFATTTVEEAGEIIKDFSGSINQDVVADLFGFGASGVDVGQPGGGLTVGKTIGTAKQVKALAKECANNGIDVFFNYDMMFLSSKGSGITPTNGGSAKGPSHTYQKKQGYLLGHGGRSNELKFYHVSRLELPGFAKKVINNCKSLGVTGLSSHNLFSTVYSDCADNRYVAAGNTANDVSAILKSAKESGLALLGYSANDYAAALSDYIVEAPIHSNFYNLFDEDVPFYQIVLKGYIPTYGVAINTVTDTNLAVLRCIEAGSGLRFSVINTHHVDLLPSNYQMFATRLYSDLKDEMVEITNATADLYDAIADAKIKEHKILADGVRSVTYDNGVIVYVNYTKKAYESAHGTVNAGSYIFAKGV